MILQYELKENCQIQFINLKNFGGKMENLNLLVLSHYVEEYKGVKAHGRLSDAVKANIQQVSKLECDSNIMFNLLCHKLGINAPDILPIATENNEASIVSGILQIDNIKSEKDIYSAYNFHNRLNEDFDYRKVLESANMENNQRAIDILRNFADGDRLVDKIFSKGALDTHINFSDKALIDLFKIRLARMATFDTTSNLSNIYKLDHMWSTVDEVLATKNDANLSDINQGLSGERLMYKNEFNLTPLYSADLIKTANKNSILQSVLDKEQKDEIVESLSTFNTKEEVENFADKTGLKVDAQLADCVSRNKDNICEELVK